MRVLVTTWAWPSHYHPLVPVSWALVAAGHEVRVATQPGGGEALRRPGLVLHEIGDPVDFPALFGRMAAGLAGKNGPGGAQDALAARAEVNGALLDELVPLAGRLRPDLVLHNPATQAGPLLAALLGVPAVRVLPGPDFGYRAKGSGLDAGAALTAVRARHGLSEVDLSGTLTLDPCPAALRVEAAYRRQPMRHVPFTGHVTAPVLPERPAGGPRVCVTWGATVPTLGAAAPALEPVVDALAELAGEVVVGDVTAEPGLSAPDERGVRVAGAVPLPVLLPECDLLVSQGGAGTVLAALLAGIPHLIVPQIADQGFNAELVERAGAGRALPASDCDPAQLRRLAGELLADQSYRAAARRAGAEMTQLPSPAEVVGVLAELTETNRV